MKITTEKVNEIAQELSCGMTAFLNKQTGEMLSIPDMDNPYFEKELWKDELKIIKEQKKQLVKITPMDSGESFQVMRGFLDQITDSVIKNMLLAILNSKHPFSTFKSAIDSSPYRQQWFEYKDQALRDYVKSELQIMGIEVNE